MLLTFFYLIFVCVQLGIGGYNHKQHVLLSKIMEKLTNFQIDPKRFEILKENVSTLFFWKLYRSWSKLSLTLPVLMTGMIRLSFFYLRVNDSLFLCLYLSSIWFVCNKFINLCLPIRYKFNYFFLVSFYWFSIIVMFIMHTPILLL